MIAASIALGLAGRTRFLAVGPTSGGGSRPEPADDPIQRPIPSSGEPLPVIGMGTWQTFDVGGNQGARAALRDVLRTFVERGGRVIDSSPMYGTSEAVYGDLAAELGLGDRMFTATKVWTRGREAGIAQMKASIKKMRVARLDLMQVHNLLDVATHRRTLRAWRDEGRIRYLGVTHYLESAHEDVARVIRSEPIDVVQINYSLDERGAERMVLPLARERGVAVIVNRPFGGGGLFGRVRGRPLPPWAAEYDVSSWAQLFLKFVVSHPAVTCAIPATSRVEHLVDNMGAGFGRLPDGAGRERIAALF